MDRISAVLAVLLGSSLKEISSEETFSTYSLKVEGCVVPPLDRGAFESATSALPPGRWTLSAIIDGQDSPHSLASIDAAEIDRFLSDLGYGAALEPHATLTFRFSKTHVNCEVLVFDPNALFNWINRLSLYDALVHFDRIVGECGAITFLSPAFSHPVETKFFRFAQARTTPPLVAVVSARSDLLAARREQTVSDWNTLNLLPDDFRWAQKATIPALEKSFAALENFLGIVSLADSTISTERGVAVKVKGSVVREEDISWANIPTKPDISIRNLFEWSYRASGAGPLADKLGIVRNFISLYWEYGILSLDVRVVAAVRSGYSLYLKKNLKDFVELRAKVASFIVEIDGKAAKSVETATGNLEKNFYGLTTFITSVVLIKVLQDKTFRGAFSPQLTLVGAALLAISALHACFARYSALKEMERATALYSDLRQLYSAFFTASDFDSIFKSDGKSPIKKTEDYVRARLRGLMWVWGTTLVIAGGLLYALSR